MFNPGLEVLKHGQVSIEENGRIRALNKVSSWSRPATLDSIELVVGKIDAIHMCEKGYNVKSELRTALSNQYRNISIPRNVVATFHSPCGFLSYDSDLSSMASRHKVPNVANDGVFSRQNKDHDPPTTTERTDRFGYESPAKKSRTGTSPRVISIDREKALPHRDKSFSHLSVLKSVQEPSSSDEADVAFKNGTTDDVQKEKTYSDKSDIVQDNHSDKVSIIEILSSSSEDLSIVEIVSAGAYPMLFLTISLCTSRPFTLLFAVLARINILVY